MQDPYPATFQRRHHNISLGAVFFSLHVNNNLSEIHIRTNFKKRDSNTVQIEGFSDGNIDGISIQATKDGKFSASGKFDGTWNSAVGLATKDDLSTGINAHIDPRIKIEWSNDPVGLLITVDRNNKRLIPSNAMTTIS